MECLAPGTIQKASSPLEVTLSVQPTLVVQNALPFEMRVLLWQHLPATAGGGGPGEGGTPLPTSTGGEPSGLGPRLSPVRAGADWFRRMEADAGSWRYPPSRPPTHPVCRTPAAGPEHALQPAKPAANALLGARRRPLWIH